MFDFIPYLYIGSSPTIADYKEIIYPRKVLEIEQKIINNLCANPGTLKYLNS